MLLQIYYLQKRLDDKLITVPMSNNCYLRNRINKTPFLKM